MTLMDMGRWNPFRKNKETLGGVEDAEDGAEEDSGEGSKKPHPIQAISSKNIIKKSSRVLLLPLSGVSE